MAASCAGIQNIRIYRSMPDSLLWTAPAAPMVAVEAATDTLMTLTEEGLLTEYQLGTGTVRRSARIQVPLVGSESAQLTMRLYRDRLTVRATKFTEPQPSVQTISFDRATLQPAAPSLVDSLAVIQECGPVLCGSTFERTYILDKDTLAELWQTDISAFPMWTGSGLLLEGNVWLVDERTGRIMEDVAGWEMAYSRRSSSGEPLIPLVVRRRGTRTYVAVVTREGIQVLGSIPRPLSDCQYRYELLLCRTEDGHLGIWRHHPRM